MIYDCLVDERATEILPVSCFMSQDSLDKLERGEWYSHPELCDSVGGKTLEGNAVFFGSKGKKFRLGNYEKENTRMNKGLTPIFVDGKNIYA